MVEPEHEGRRSPRVGRHWFVHFRPMNSPDAPWAVGRVKDLSGTGVCFTAAEALEVDTHLELKFNLPMPVLPVAQGKVVRHGEVQGQHEYGIDFEGLDPALRASVEEFVAQLLKRRS
jgi:c-di-GMP-binding flagellar brake protein YcgR